jgi:hypothetical protein
MPPARRLRACALALAAALPAAAAAPAQADPALSGVSAKAADTAAGAHASFAIAFDITGLGATGAGGDDLKSLRLDLPAGLIGNPQAPGATCSKAQLAADSCPAATRVGTTTTVADLLLLGMLDLSNQTISGDVYNVATSGPEAARLGIVLRPPLGLPKVILESPVTVRGTDGGLTSTVDGVPRTTTVLISQADLRIDRMTLTLLGKLPSGKAFMTNPTSCAPAVTTVTIGTYAGKTATGTGSFTPTACAALPFAPQLSAKIGAARDDLRPAAQPEVTVLVTQQPGEANTKTVSVALPTGLGASVPALANACPVETYDAGRCPPISVVGSGEAATPLLPTPLTGPVTFVSDPSLGLPRLRVALHGAFDVNLTGVVTVGPLGGLVNNFDGIYDVPLSRFVLTIKAGPTSPLRVARDLCLPGGGDLTGTFVAHSGKTATASAVAERVGCDAIRPTRLRARLGRLGAGHPALRVTAANDDRPVRSLSFRLPRGLSLAPGARKRIRVAAAGSSGRPAIGLRHGRVTVSLPGNGAPAVDVLVPGRAIRVARSLRRARHPRPRLTVEVRLVGRPVQHRRIGARLVPRP